MSASDSFHDFNDRLTAGDDSAAEEIVGRYSRALTAKVRQHLDPAVREKIDADDVVTVCPWFVFSTQPGWRFSIR